MFFKQILWKLIMLSLLLIFVVLQTKQEKKENSFFCLTRCSPTKTTAVRKRGVIELFVHCLFNVFFWQYITEMSLNWCYCFFITLFFRGKRIFLSLLTPVRRRRSSLHVLTAVVFVDEVKQTRFQLQLEVLLFCSYLQKKRWGKTNSIAA